MKHSIKQHVTVFVSCSLFLIGIVGCGTKSQAPDEISPSELPSKVTSAFASADGGRKELADAAVRAFKKEDYVQAVVNLQDLVARDHITKEQREVTSRSLITVNNRLREAKKSGDRKAKEVLEFQEEVK